LRWATPISEELAEVVESLVAEVEARQARAA
jgi:hypothetical protein